MSCFTCAVEDMDCDEAEGLVDKPSEEAMNEPKGMEVVTVVANGGGRISYDVGDDNHHPSHTSSTQDVSSKPIESAHPVHQATPTQFPRSDWAAPMEESHSPEDDDDDDSSSEPESDDFGWLDKAMELMKKADQGGQLHDDDFQTVQAMFPWPKVPSDKSEKTGIEDVNFRTNILEGLKPRSSDSNESSAKWSNPENMANGKLQDPIGSGRKASLLSKWSKTDTSPSTGDSHSPFLLKHPSASPDHRCSSPSPSNRTGPLLVAVSTPGTDASSESFAATQSSSWTGLPSSAVSNNPVQSSSWASQPPSDVSNSPVQSSSCSSQPPSDVSNSPVRTASSLPPSDVSISRVRTASWTGQSSSNAVSSACSSRPSGDFSTPLQLKIDPALPQGADQHRYNASPSSPFLKRSVSPVDWTFHPIRLPEPRSFDWIHPVIDPRRVVAPENTEIVSAIPLSESSTPQKKRFTGHLARLHRAVDQDSEERAKAQREWDAVFSQVKEKPLDQKTFEEEMVDFETLLMLYHLSVNMTRNYHVAPRSIPQALEWAFTLQKLGKPMLVYEPTQVELKTLALQLAEEFLGFVPEYEHFPLAYMAGMKVPPEWFAFRFQNVGAFDGLRQCLEEPLMTWVTLLRCDERWKLRCHYVRPPGAAKDYAYKWTHRSPCRDDPPFSWLLDVCCGPSYDPLPDGNMLLAINKSVLDDFKRRLGSYVQKVYGNQLHERIRVNLHFFSAMDMVRLDFAILYVGYIEVIRYRGTEGLDVMRLWNVWFREQAQEFLGCLHRMVDVAQNAMLLFIKYSDGRKFRRDDLNAMLDQRIPLFDETVTGIEGKSH